MGTADGEKTMEQRSSYPRALIIEDEPLIALGLEAQLRELGFKACDIASDGRQALSHALNNRPNVAVVDVNLEGGREGIEVARILRERSDVPIVFVTGCTNSETIEHIRSEVPAPVLPKPLWGPSYGGRGRSPNIAHVVGINTTGQSVAAAIGKMSLGLNHP